VKKLPLNIGKSYHFLDDYDIVLLAQTQDLFQAKEPLDVQYEPSDF
jgi:hypothetical protein